MINKAQTMEAGCAHIPPRLSGEMSLRPGPIVLTVCAIIGSVAVLFWFNPSEHGFYPFCWFHKTTGLLCPGCGSLRALHQLLHGHVAAAFRFNALLISSLPVALWYFGGFTLRKVQRQPASLVIRPFWLWCALAVMVVFGVLRNLPFASTAWLAP